MISALNIWHLTLPVLESMPYRAEHGIYIFYPILRLGSRGK